MTELYYDEIPSPIGSIFIACDGDAMCTLYFSDFEERMWQQLKPRYPDAKLTRRHDPFGYRTLLDRYFQGDLASIEEIKVTTRGTPFQRKVWHELRSIPAGSTASYGEMAARIGCPKACRAVGLANGQNPVSIVLPCHRVIGANGSLTGYGGGLDRKRWLLRHEGQNTTSAQLSMATAHT
ncbi:MAG TPA: methylated-DNA--[protein]-cysteine S-methyltransferase [Bryobacteraceae bacterium]|nr:methylated-DNA--[protein]-cysteine S-methyltransferase [Bryobacteraceae bacterium]